MHSSEIHCLTLCLSSLVLAISVFVLLVWKEHLLMVLHAQLRPHSDRAQSYHSASKKVSEINILQ